MDLREQQNIFKLLGAGFGLVNRTGTALVIYIVVFILANLFSLLLTHWNVSVILVQLFNICITSFLAILLCRVLAAKADNFGESFSNSLSASVFPALYLLLFNLIIGFFGFLLALVFVPILRYSGTTGLIILGLIGWFFSVRLSFVMPALALRDQGPVRAILYSWEMTRGLKNFFKTFFVIFLCGLLPTLFILAVSRVLYVAIPLYFADSFNLAELTPPWYAVGGICVLGVFLTACWGLATFLLYFLNCDYGENRSSFTPMPEAKLASQTTQVFGENNNVLPPGIGKTVTKEDVENVTVVKSSVKTVADDNEFKEHLNQVYQPKPEDFVQYDEEDRMPTILFDDEMAKQIEENRQMWTKKENKTPQNEDGSDGESIKMSK